MFLIARISREFGIKNKEFACIFVEDKTFIYLTLKISQKNNARLLAYSMYVYLIPYIQQTAHMR